MPFISRNRKYFNNTYENVDRNTPIFASDIEAIDGKEGVSIMTNPAFYIMTSTGTNTVSNGYLVTYDLGKDCKGINYINYNPICVANRYPACILNNVQASPDNKNWVTISSRFGSRNVNCQLDFPTPNTYRFLRFTTSNDDGNYGYGGVNSFKINYIKQELVSSEEGTEDNHNSFIDTDKRLYNFVVNRRHYYKYGTEPNATVTGSFARIDKGVTSGFSSANYLTLPTLFDISKGEAWEVVFKFNTNSPSAQQTFLGSAGSRAYNPRIRLRDGFVNIMLTNSTSSANVVSISGVTSILANVDYWIKAEFTGTAYNLYLSTDGVVYNLEATKETTAVFTASYQLSLIGYLYDSGSVAGYPFDGSIDLTQSYIKINNELWWSGDEYTKVGSWIDEGVASGFTTANYLNLPNTFKPEGNSWEICFKVHTPSSHTEEAIFSKYTSDTYYGLRLALENTGKIYYLVSATSGAKYLFEGVGTNTIPTDTDVLIKFQFTGSKYIGQISNDNGETWITDKEYDSTTKMYDWNSASTIGYYAGKGIPFKGLIDFNESYIKINGKEWWHGTKAVEIPASEIDNWGTTRYFKNVVTTKYWKEITTEVEEDILAYAAYFSSSAYFKRFYAKTPLGEDLTVFCGTKYNISDFTPDWAANESEIQNAHTALSLNDKWVSVTDSTAIHGYENGVYTRSYENDVYKETTVTETVEGTPEDYTYTTEESSIIEVTADDDYDYIESTPSDDFDYYLDRIVNYFPVKRSGNAFVSIFESESAGTFEVNLSKDNKYRISIVGGGGAAAMKGVYDDRGYGWTGGSGGAFVGEFELPAGTYSVTVGSANNNTTAQSGNSQTLNPSDKTTHDSYITGIVRVGGGGAGTTSGVGAAGAAATFEMEPTYIELNTKGNAGSSGSGGKGSGANWTHNGAASVYKGYGKGQGCSTSEYGSRRYWIAGTNGYVKIEVWSESEIRSY